MPRIKYKPAVCQKLFHLSITAHCFAHHLDHLICRCLFNKVPSQNETGIIIQQKKKIYFELVYIKLKNIHLGQFKWTGCFKPETIDIFFLDRGFITVGLHDAPDCFHGNCYSLAPQLIPDLARA